MVKLVGAGLAVQYAGNVLVSTCRPISTIKQVNPNSVLRMKVVELSLSFSTAQESPQLDV